MISRINDKRNISTANKKEIHQTVALLEQLNSLDLMDLWDATEATIVVKSFNIVFKQ